MIRRAEFLSVGTELLLGEIVDTNSAWLAQDVARRGVDVLWSQRVGDNLGRIVEGLKQALSRSDLVVMCGGLGPTDDDMSREAIAETVGETPEVDQDLERTLREWFQKFSRTMPERNLKQAWLIPSAEALPNPLGTAPGWFVRVNGGAGGKVIVALPGPPRELRRMWLEEVVKRLELPQSALYSKTFKTQGLGESAAAEKLGELTLRANPSVATYAKRDGVHVRVAAKAETDEEAERLAAPVVRQVREVLGSRIWGEDNDELAALIVARLQQRGKTLALMEGVTSGLLSDLLTSVVGAAAVYPGGVVADGAQTKAAFGVSQEVLDAHGDISQETAGAMAEAAATSFSSDYALATTGVPGPSEEDGKPVGETHLALHDVARGESETRSFKLPELERNWLRERTAYAALAFFWVYLRGE